MGQSECPSTILSILLMYPGTCVMEILTIEVSPSWAPGRVGSIDNEYISLFIMSSQNPKKRHFASTSSDSEDEGFW